MGKERENIKIMVAMHKSYRKPQGEMYLPVQVGKFLSKQDLQIQGDDDGENISEKNRNYCELTALYWAWKNLDADYIGLVHYRRYFSLHRKKDKWESVLNEKDVTQILKDVPVILPRKRNYIIETNESQYLHAHHREGWEAMYRTIAADYPKYLPSLNRMRKSRSGHRFNMFIMRRDCFMAYCEWLFDILFQVEQEIDISGYSESEARVFGYLSERMLDVWIETNGISYKELGVVFMERQHWVKKGMAFLKRKILWKENDTTVYKC